jgi:uncharacterized RDD family membrane protein YckC
MMRDLKDHSEYTMEVWIGRDGERHGPYKEADVREWLRNGQVSPSDLGWYEGIPDWQPLSSLFPEEFHREPAASASTIPPLPQTDAKPITVDYASFWQRFGAWVIDLVVLAVPSSIAFYAFGGVEAYTHLLAELQANPNMSSAIQDYAEATRGASFAMVLIGFLYYTLFECSKWQATPGKLALRLRVTGMDGEGLTLARSAARNAVRLFNLFTGLVPFVCYIAVAWTQRKQGLHDLVAHTLVINGRAGESNPLKSRTDQGPNHGSFNA